jgi:hypothetical protein
MFSDIIALFVVTLLRLSNIKPSKHAVLDADYPGEFVSLYIIM